MSSRHGLATCHTCRQPIRWTVTEAGKRLAVNPDPNEDGNTAAYRDGLGTWRSRRPSDELPLAPFERLYMPHAATCQHRQPAPGQLPDGVVSLAEHRRTRRGTR